MSPDPLKSNPHPLFFFSFSRSLAFLDIAKYKEVVNHLITDTDKMAPQCCLAAIRNWLLCVSSWANERCLAQTSLYNLQTGMKRSPQNKHNISCILMFMIIRIIKSVSEMEEDIWTDTRHVKWCYSDWMSEFNTWNVIKW